MTQEPSSCAMSVLEQQRLPARWKAGHLYAPALPALRCWWEDL